MSHQEALTGLTVGLLSGRQGDKGGQWCVCMSPTPHHTTPHHTTPSPTHPCFSPQSWMQDGVSVSAEVFFYLIKEPGRLYRRTQRGKQPVEALKAASFTQRPPRATPFVHVWCSISLAMTPPANGTIVQARWIKISALFFKTCVCPR